jgi:hypothetical protein
MRKTCQTFSWFPPGGARVDKMNCPEMKIRCPKADGHSNPRETMTPKANSSNARRKENYNYHKVSALLADYGFTTLRLSDDWQGADFIAQHIDGRQFVKVQLKGRLYFGKKYVGKELFVAFHRDALERAGSLPNVFSPLERADAFARLAAEQLDQARNVLCGEGCLPPRSPR